MNFTQMLDEIYDSLGNVSGDTIILPPPVIEKGTTRIVWKNVKDFLKITKTPPEHFYDFIEKESSRKINWFSESISDGLIIHYNRVTINEITMWMRKYISEYVLCKVCKHGNTEMVRDSNIRKWYVKCKDCNAEYTI